MADAHWDLQIGDGGAGGEGRESHTHTEESRRLLMGINGQRRKKRHLEEEEEEMFPN
jgi:hypothetical protein